MSAPIVLVHGIFGFNQLTLGGLELAGYFRQIAEALREDGHNVPSPPQLNPAGSVANRAIDLRAYLRSHPGVADRPVHLVAHSMGGLDARYMIAKLGMAEYVLSLTTIGTPHHGSPVADLIRAHADPRLDRLAQALGLDLQGIADLSTDACRDFNAAVGEADDVHYHAIAGRYEPPALLRLASLLGLTQGYVAEREGPNDGLVSLRSAHHGADPDRWDYLGTWEASHFRLVNWGDNIVPSPLELLDRSIVEQYRSLARYLQRLPARDDRPPQP